MLRVQPRFDITIGINYYAPYVSGLTEAARLIAEELAGRGWRVAVAAIRHDSSLPRREIMNGVAVFRAAAIGSVGRGKVSPAFVALAIGLGNRSNVLNLHTPMLEAGVISRLTRASVVTTYHIDLYLPPSPRLTALSRGLNTLAVRAVDASARAAMRHSAAVVVNSEDQARGSKLWSVLQRTSLRAIASPCVDRSDGEPAFREGHGLHVGFLGRIVEEKGLEYLIRGFRRHAGANDRLLIGGDYTNVAGGSNIRQLMSEIRGDNRIKLLGLLRGREINDFYASIDVFALPSISESFGIVQAEAMMAGIPSVTTNFPGGRHPVLATGFGRVVPLRDPDSLMDAIRECSTLSGDDRSLGRKKARALFGLTACIDSYEDVFREASKISNLTSRRPGSIPD